MSRYRIPGSALTGLLLVGSRLLAQAQPATIYSPGSTLTTAIVGVTSTQTARLNVLNLQPVIPGVTAIACPATLEFYDDSGAQLKQLALISIAPGTSASLIFKPVVASTSPAARAQIRGVLYTPPTTPTNDGTGSNPISILPVSTGCSLMASLEIIDDATGATRVFSTDFRYMPGFNARPLTLLR